MSVNKYNSTNHMTYTFAPLSIIRIGLGLVFLANALVAITRPEEFIELLEASAIFSIFPKAAETITKIIAVNDMLVALLLIAGFGGRKLFAWTTVWIAGALAIIGQPLDMLEESGILAMSVALFSAQNRNKEKSKRGA